MCAAGLLGRPLGGGGLGLSRKDSGVSPRKGRASSDQQPGVPVSSGEASLPQEVCSQEDCH